MLQQHCKRIKMLIYIRHLIFYVSIVFYQKYSVKNQPNFDEVVCLSIQMKSLGKAKPHLRLLTQLRVQDNGQVA